MRPLTLRLCGPRGFCAGVDRAIQIVLLALKKYKPPVYVRHEIVHNRYVVEGLKQRGAVFIEELHEIPEKYRHKAVIFSAHGVPKSVILEANKKNIFYLDATCPLVSKVHKQALRHQRLGRHVLLIGHHGHPEVIGTMGQLSAENVTLIETEEDAYNFKNSYEALGYVSQTTLSIADTHSIISILKKRFPEIESPAAESICYATTNRQIAVKKAAKNCDLFFIVGAPNSSNSRRLVEVAERYGSKKAILVQEAKEICWKMVDEAKIVSLSAGASTPDILIDNIIEDFKKRYKIQICLAISAIEDETFLVNRELRNLHLDLEDMMFLTGSAKK